MDKLNLKDIEWVIIKTDYSVMVRASIGDLSLGSKVYKYVTREEAKKRASDFIIKNGSLN
jgi:hypothetical protein